MQVIELNVEPLFTPPLVLAAACYLHATVKCDQNSHAALGDMCAEIKSWWLLSVSLFADTGATVATNVRSLC